MFTAAVLEGGTGIGDQLYQTQLLYNLGRSCGWRYVHNVAPRAWVNRDRPRLGRRRHDPVRFDYHDFLGLTIGQEVLGIPEQHRFIDVDARDLLGHLMSGGALPFREGDHQGAGDMVRLHFNPWFYRDYETCS
ncbi:unnamed protein product, partial [marine sediment metagenome]